MTNFNSPPSIEGVNANTGDCFKESSSKNADVLVLIFNRDDTANFIIIHFYKCANSIPLYSCNILVYSRHLVRVVINKLEHGAQLLFKKMKFFEFAFFGVLLGVAFSLPGQLQDAYFDDLFDVRNTNLVDSWSRSKFINN